MRRDKKNQRFCSELLIVKKWESLSLTSLFHQRVYKKSRVIKGYSIISNVTFNFSGKSPPVISFNAHFWT